MSKSIATAAEVRSWATAKGLTASSRGRLSADTVEAFNKAHRAVEHVVGIKPERTIKVSVPTEDKRGRKITKTVAVPAADLRAAVGAEGKRGRVSAAAAREFVIEAGLV